MDVDPMPVVPPTAATAQTMDVSDAARKEDRKEDAMPPPSPGMQARLDADDDLSELIPKIQMNTASNNRCEANAMPTVVPAPQKQFFGVLGQRHVICINGLPNNGKKFVAYELGWYLEFFYGAKVAYFQVEDYTSHASREANALALLEDVQKFLRKAGGISRPHSFQQGGETEADASFAKRRKENTDSGRVAIVLPPRMAALSAMDDETAKEAWASTWSCTNAVDRNWIRKRLVEAGEDYKLMFIEIELTDKDLLKQHDQVRAHLLTPLSTS